jgi:hypothetical protein
VLFDQSCSNVAPDAGNAAAEVGNAGSKVEVAVGDGSVLGNPMNGSPSLGDAAVEGQVQSAHVVEQDRQMEQWKVSSSILKHTSPTSRGLRSSRPLQPKKQVCFNSCQTEENCGTGQAQGE